jgi:hypothetical protein
VGLVFDERDAGDAQARPVGVDEYGREGIALGVPAHALPGDPRRRRRVGLAVHQGGAVAAEQDAALRLAVAVLPHQLDEGALGIEEVRGERGWLGLGVAAEGDARRRRAVVGQQLAAHVRRGGGEARPP